MPSEKEQVITLYWKSIALGAVIAPAAIQAHEIMGHALPAKLMGAKGISIGYTTVDVGNAESWSVKKKAPINAGGPIVTNVFVYFGLQLMKSNNNLLKILGFSVVISAYRGILVVLRQVLTEKPTDEDQTLTDESQLAKGIGVSKYLISLPQAGFSIWSLLLSYRLLPEKVKSGLSLTTFLGTIIGTMFYVKVLGPLFWRSQKVTPELKRLATPKSNDL